MKRSLHFVGSVFFYRSICKVGEGTLVSSNILNIGGRV
jgi:hypothetical protein